MAEEVGGIVYEVGMDVSGLTTGGQKVNKVLQEIEKSIDESIAGINKLDTGLKNTASTVEKSGRSFSSLNNAMRQGGYQIQDFVVQVQSGQSALVALSQQGSQLLSVFGSGGAVAGALLTIGTVIVGSLIAGMDNATVSTKALTAAQQRLADIFQLSANGVVVLSDKFATLAKQSENAARAQLTMALIDANNIIKASVQGVNELGDALGSWKAPLSAAISQLDTLKARGIDVNTALKNLGGTYEGNILGLNQLNQVVKSLADEFGISAEDALKLVEALAAVRKNANPETIAELRDLTVDLSQKYGYANKSLSELTGKVGEYSISADQAAESTKLATDMLNGHKVASEEDARATEENTKRLQAYIQSIKEEGETIAFTARQKALYRAEQLGASDADKQTINSSFDKIEAYKAELAAKKEQEKQDKKRIAASTKQANLEESVAQKLEKLRQQTMLNATSTSELSREQAILNAQQSLGKAATQEQIKLAGEYAAKIWDQKNALKQQAAAEKEKQRVEKSYQGLRSIASPTTSIDNEYQQRMADLDAYAAAYPQKITEIEQTRAAIEAQYRQQRMDAMWAEWQQQSLGAQLFGTALDSAMSTASNSITGLLTGTMSVQDAMRSLGSTVLNSLVNSFVEMGVQWVKSAVMGQTAQVAATATTTAAQTAGLATTTAASTAAAATTTAAWTPAAIVASIGSFGGAAAIGVGAVLGALAMGIAGKRKNGGPVSAGSMYEVGEGNAPEIFQASTGRQYMIPGNSGKVISNKDISGGGGGVVVYNNLYNNSSNASATSRATDNGDGSITIETFISDMNEGGPMSQSISRNFNTNRRATE
ncbi:tail length tape measure protein [Salmonella phage 64795_sal3]|uniref:Tape measure protein n=1 Tax=Salmonella phage 64795_sal3 TaxID=1813769 RepID=A0A173GC04_9CAUD|nr:tail length tape measure protein [Salmonella phage 64795_sal3]ANH50884.1 tape measure protein [Salmonella phage 64795_sal3]EIN1803786.1 phage tail length tape measure family protein [Salmonella enterica]